MQSSVECLRENLYSSSPQSVGSQLEALVERTEDFTDSAYTSHEQRQAILSVCQLARQDTQQLMNAWIEAVCCARAQMFTPGRECSWKHMLPYGDNYKYLICQTPVKGESDNKTHLRPIWAKKTHTHTHTWTHTNRPTHIKPPSPAPSVISFARSLPLHSSLLEQQSIITHLNNRFFLPWLLWLREKHHVVFHVLLPFSRISLAFRTNGLMKHKSLWCSFSLQTFFFPRVLSYRADAAAT